MLRTIIVEGIGDAADRLYEPALKMFKAEKGDALKVIFTDMKSLWLNKPELRKKREGTLKRLRSWQAKYLDKSYLIDGSNFKDYEAYQQLRDKEIDVVFVATPDDHHAEVVEHWLASNSCKQIFVEKPLERNHAAAMRITEQIPQGDSRVRVFDHYRARVHNDLRDYAHLKRAVLQPLGGDIRKFSFYMLEDHSGNDDKYCKYLKERNLRQRHGPIENEQRVDALKQGLIFDLMPHMPAILYYFGYLGTIQTFRVRAGMYRGVDNKPNKLTEINGETFAHIEFQFESFKGNKVDGEAYVGKGIRGAQKLPEMDGNVKALVLEGINGRQFVFDLRSEGKGSSTGRLLKARGNAETILRFRRDPYYYLLQDIDKGEDKGVSLGLPVATGLNIFELLKKMRYKLEGKKKSDYPTYSLGVIGKTPAPYAEQLLEGPDVLPLSYGIEHTNNK